MTPFLKWAGGKRWLVRNYSRFLPEFYNNYLEPFLGSGAMYFHVNPENAILNDLNKDLIATYQGIKDYPKEVIEILKQHQENHSKSYYYEIRSKKFETLPDKTARFIYLNKTCFNGLYRVNLNGEFNVPIGTKSNVCDGTDDYIALSKILKSAELYSIDFENIIDMAGEDDFVFADPPYTVTHNNNGFVKYNEKLFSWQDQERLAASLKRAVMRGAKILSTNAFHDSVKDLYGSEFTLTPLSRSSTIAGKSNARGKYQELLISNK